MAGHTIPSQTPSSTRFFDRRNIKTPLEQFAAGLCTQAGVRYKGIQKGFEILADQVMFDNHFGSTLCLPIPGLTADAIVAAVARSNEQWERHSDGGRA